MSKQRSQRDRAHAPLDPVAAWRIFLINLFLLSFLALMGVGVFLLYVALGYAMGMVRAIWGGRSTGKTPQSMTGSLASILWLRWRIFLANLGLRYVEWQIEQQAATINPQA